jgi:hypothetical protein
LGQLAKRQFLSLFILFILFSVNSSSKQPLMADIDTTRKIINDLFEDSGSGMGNPLLIRRTIANQIALKETIGQGRFGEV